jgi:hypothetical protein
MIGELGLKLVKASLRALPGAACCLMQFAECSMMARLNFGGSTTGSTAASRKHFTSIDPAIQGMEKSFGSLARYSPAKKSL